MVVRTRILSTSPEPNLISVSCKTPVAFVAKMQKARTAIMPHTREGCELIIVSVNESQRLSAICLLSSGWCDCCDVDKVRSDQWPCYCEARHLTEIFRVKASPNTMNPNLHERGIIDAAEKLMVETMAKYDPSHDRYHGVSSPTSRYVSQQTERVFFSSTRSKYSPCPCKSITHKARPSCCRNRLVSGQWFFYGLRSNIFCTNY